MQTFLDTTFDAEFASPAWNTNWSTATDQTMTSRISTTEIVDTSVSANQSASVSWRGLHHAERLRNANLSQATFQSVSTRRSASSATPSMTSRIGGSVGTVQQRVTGATEKLKTQQDLFNNQVNAMEEVVPEEASVRVNNLQTQIEMALSLTARIQQISLINYL